MNNYNNMSDDELLAVLNSMADKFENNQLSNEAEPKPVNVQRWEDMNISLEDTPMTSNNTEQNIDIEMPIVNPLYTIDKNGNLVFSNIRPSQQRNAYRITPDKGSMPDYGNMGFLERRRKTLFESEIGIAYSYKMSW